jgi:hypothetical protein
MQVLEKKKRQRLREAKPRRSAPWGRQVSTDRVPAKEARLNRHCKEPRCLPRQEL